MATESAIAYVSVVPQAKGAGKLIEQQIDPAGLGASVGSKMSGSFLKSVGSMAVQTTKIVGGAVTAIGATIAGIAAKKGLDRLLDIDDARGKLRGLGHDVEGIAAIMDSALASVKGTAFGLGDAAGVAASAVAAGIKPGQDLTKYLSLTADAATIAGVSLGEMGSIINKTTTSGKVYTDSLNQLADRGIPIFQWLQDEYGVTAEELSKMVSNGEVDSATFRKVIEENIGGAALASGQTVRGSLANVGAALGRIGAMFLGGAVAGAPALFGSITAATDRAGAALQPYADILSEKVAAGMSTLAGWIDRIDFAAVIDGVSSFGVQVKDVFSSIASGASDANLSEVGASFTELVSAGSPMLPVLGQIWQGLGQIAGSVGGLFAAGLPLLSPIIDSFASILRFLGDNTEYVTPLIVALAAGFVLYRASQTAANAAMVAGLPLRVASTAADIARTVALNNSTRATLLSMGIERASIGTRIAATGSITAATLALNVQSAAQRASAIASGIAAGGMRVLGAAVRFAMGPIGIIITIVGALVAGLIWFFTQTELGQGIVQAAFAAIHVAVAALGQVFAWLWENAIKPAWDAISAGATWLYENALKPAFDGIALAVQVVGGAVQLYIGFWVSIFQAVATAATWLWQNILAPAFQGIFAVVSWVGTAVFAIFDLLVHILVFVVGAAVTWLYETIFKPVFDLIGVLVAAWWAGAQIVFNAVVSFVRDTLGAIFTWLWTNVISPVFTWISERFALFQVGAQIIFAAIVAFVQTKLAPIFTWLWMTIIKPAFDGISSVISTVWNGGIKPIFDALAGFVKDTLPKAFETGRDAVGTAWDGLKELAKVPIKFVVDTVINDGIIKNFNKVADFFGSSKIPEISLPKGFRTGGILPGQSRMRDGDDQLVPMRKGEGVLVSEGLRTAADRSAFLAANAAGRRGIGFASLMGGGYAKGGIIDGALDWVKDAAGTAARFVADPKSAMSSLVDGLIKQVPGAGGMVDLAKGLGTKMVSAAVEKIQALAGTFSSVAGGGNNGQLPQGQLMSVPFATGGPGVGASGGMLRRDAALAAIAADRAARAATGAGLSLTEGYRDLSSQQMRWAQYKAGKGNLAAAPGTSNHGLGLAGDFGASARGWLTSNGPKFGWYPTGLGFSQREPWHFDFKGVPQLAAGAFIKSTPGGSLVNVGEGRYDEAVVPLSPGFKEALAGRTEPSARGGDTHWHITEVTDTRGTAMAISRRENGFVV